MSEVAPKSDPFKDYCTADNSDDEETNNDLQARLYAEIYYQTNIDGEWRAQGISSQPNSGFKKPLTKPNKQTQNRDPLQFKAIKLKLSTYHNTLHAGSIVDPQVSIDIRESHLTEQAELVVNTSLETDRGNLIDLETIGVIDSPNYDNSAIDENDNTNFITPTGPTLTRRKSSQESFNMPKYKHKKKLQDIVIIDDTNIDTKYMVLEKRVKQERFLINKSKQALQNSSDSEESIFEVPVPPKPLPPVINLQDSDNEDATSSTTEEDDPLVNQCDKNANSCASSEVEIVEMRTVDDQDAYAKITNKFLRNKNATTKYDRNGYDMHNVSEDIVLNCTTVQKGAKNIGEIKQLSRNVEMEQKKQKQTSANQDMSRNSKAKSLQDVSRANGEKNTTRIVQQNINKIDAKRNTRNVMLRRADQDLIDNTSVEISFENNLVMDRKRHREVSSEGEKNNDSTQKRQCTIISQQNNQNAALTLVRNSKMADGRRKIRMNWNEYFFKPMSEELRRFYSDSRGQENFDIRELQRKMSKNPRMWAILDEDLMPSPGRRGSRYWSTVRCNYCQRDGHLRKDCPEPPRTVRCYMCGEPGHTDKRCPYKMCLTCGKKQNSFRKTCDHCRTLYCTMCNSIGHRMMQCPDLWRRYHHITTETGRIPSDPGDVMKPAYQLHCCNCTRRGHEASTCMEYRWSLHFATPATVTSYTKGPLYISNTISNEVSECKTANVSSNRTDRNNKTSISQKSKGIPETSAHVENFLNVDTLQQANAPVDSECTSKTNKCSVSSFNIQSPILASLKNAKKGISNYASKLDFIKIIFSYGSCQNKHAFMLVRKLDPQFLHSLDNEKDFSAFLDRLQEIVNFEITIGNLSKKYVTMQLITLNEYIYSLFYLLLYWLGLPQDEKSYGLDLNLPTNSVDMFYLMILKKKNLSKKTDSDPIKLFNQINLMKVQLNHEVQDSEQYFQLQRHIWDLQIELIIFFNTKPKRSDHVNNFWKYFNLLDKARKANNNLEIWLYLEVILIYNHLFVPHTPYGLSTMIKRFEKKANKQLKKEKCKQNKVALSTKANPSSKSQPQNNLHEDFIRIVDIQNEDQNTFVKTRSLNYILPEGSGATKSNAESFQNTASLNTKPMSVQSEGENYLSLNSVNTASNLQMIQPNANEGYKKSYSSRLFSKKMDTWNLELNELKSIKSTNSVIHGLQKAARQTVRVARALKVPYISKMIDDLKRKIKDETIKQHHIDALQKLIALEHMHKKKSNRNSYLQ